MSQFDPSPPPDSAERYPTFWPKLYKTTSKDGEQEWRISVRPVRENESVVADIVTEYGQVDGKIQTATVRVSQGKNLGRKNATTAVRQAISEADAKYKKQLDKGYSTERGGASMDLKPMLAHKYEDRKKKVAFDEAYVQPKLDGVRALAVRKGDSIVLLSRQGKEHKGLDHIRAALLTAMADGEVWDGELYTHGMKFQQLVSLVKKPQPDSAKVEYHVYDKVSDERFEDRNERLIDAVPDDGPVKYVETHVVHSHELVEQYHGEFVEEGYEGIMLRWGTEPYKSGYRSEHLLKVKAFEDAEFIIVDVVPGVGKESDKGTFVCKTDRGATFNCRPRGRDDLRAEYLANREHYRGKMLTVEFFEWTTSDPPVPRFPVGKAVRED